MYVKAFSFNEAESYQLSSTTNETNLYSETPLIRTFLGPWNVSWLDTWLSYNFTLKDMHYSQRCAQK